MRANTGPSDGQSLPMSRILRRIRERFAKGQPLNITAVKRECPGLIEPLYQPHGFVGWRKALELAGVDYSEIEIELADTVKCRLCGKAFPMLGRHLRGKRHSYTSEAYLEEFPDAELSSERIRSCIFGVSRLNHEVRPSPSLAPHWEPVWSPEYALDRLFFLHEEGHPLHTRYIQTEERALFRYLLRLFDTYDHALERIGLEPAQIRRSAPGISWNRKKILEAFGERASTGKILAYRAVAKEFPSLVSAARKHFGTYQAAIEAMGIDYGEIHQRRYPSALRREILEEAKRLASEPEYDREKIERFRKKYGRAIKVLFRRWRDLAAEAGIPTERIMCNYFPVMGREEVLECLRQRRQAELSVRRTDIARENRKLMFSMLKHFGNLGGALRAAGIPPDPSPKPLPRYKDAQAVVAAILCRQAEKKPLSVGSLVRGRPEVRDYALLRKARTFFGSWKKALAAALDSQ